MTLFWLSDIHLDRATPAGEARLLKTIRENGPNTAILTGDTSHAKRLVSDLERLAAELGGTLHFVLGNHDHYGSSVGEVRDAVIAASNGNDSLAWLPPAGVVVLPDGRALVGVDGWADGRLGDPLTTPITLNDDRLIAELAAQHDRRAKVVVRRTLADADATRLATLLRRAIDGGHRELVVATHIPPFVECLPPGSRIAHPDWYPLLVSAATGRVLRSTATRHPEVSLDVLAGHSHRASDVSILPNLRVRVAPARYGTPEAIVP
ncbi:MAG TPA: metallophosphoesterase [Gemmatimonadales bacterium]|nr:metallophosphoesterase [Gemmatimonadales bacterium]